MKWIHGAALFGLSLAAPAGATSGLLCATAGARQLTLSLVIGHAAVPALVSARLTDAGDDVPVLLAQGWIDDREVRVDLVDPGALRHEARLRVEKRGEAYDGSLWRNGRRHWVRCREG